MLETNQSVSSLTRAPGPPGRSCTGTDVVSRAVSSEGASGRVREGRLPRVSLAPPRDREPRSPPRPHRSASPFQRLSLNSSRFLWFE